MKKLIYCLLLIGMGASTLAQNTGEPVFMVKGFCINVPAPAQVDRFVKFINEELAVRGVNTLLLLVDYNYK